MADRALPYLLLGLLLVAGCATPIPPSGGPPDQTPPAIAESSPAADAVNVDADRLTLIFSEYVDQNSLAQALSVTPAFDGRLEYDWRGRRVEVAFPEPLRENTTYLFTLDTSLRDANGVALAQPLTFAFATGPTINRGRLAGRVLTPADGSGAPGFDVYAYAAPDSIPPTPLPERPAYRTQTDPDGRFQFEYMSEQPYYVVALLDRNRSRRPDAQEPFAVPPRPVVTADSAATPVDAPWLVTARDTVPPTVARVQAIADRRLVLRFSEPVRLPDGADPAGWALRDSLTGATATIEAVYLPPGTTNEVGVVTLPLRSAPYRLIPGAVADTSGNRLRPDTLRIAPSSAPDTLQARFVAFVPDTLTADEGGYYRLPPRRQPAVRFNRPLSDSLFRQVVAVADTAGALRPYRRATDDGITYRLEFDPPLAADQLALVTVDGRRLGSADTLYTRRFRRLPGTALGELSGVVATSDTTARIVVELYPAAADATAARLDVAVAGEDGRFRFDRLPAGAYRLRAFADRDGDLVWDGGTVIPYEPAEPLTWHPGDRVRPRWETTIADTLRIGDR